MATYIQGVTDYLPVIQPFQPDYNFLSNVLQTKQSRYDAAHKQLSGIYGTLLNSPMLRDQNIQRRDEFFKAIDQDIQRMSGMDLSLQQNQDAAMNVFKGFYEDKNMVKDMMWTKNYMNEQARGDAFRDCVDPDKCGGSWWEGGSRMLDYKAQEFKAATDDEALRMENVTYVPAQQIMDKAIKAAKDAGFSVSYDEIKGDWIVHSKNGSKMIQPLAQFYMSKFGSDPKVMAYKNAQAYLQRKDWVAQNLSSYNNDEASATLAYVSEMYQKNQESILRQKGEVDEAHEVLKQEKQAIQDKIQKNGYIPSMGWAAGWKDINDEAAVAEQNKAIYDEANNKIKALGYNRDNIKYAVNAIDGMVAMNMLQAETTHAASVYAMMTAEQKFEANPYAVQAKQQAFEREMKTMQQGFVDAQGIFHPGTDFYNKAELKKLEWEHEEKISKAIQQRLIGAAAGPAASAAGAMSGMRPDPTQGGTASGENADKQKLQTYNDNVLQTNELRKERADLQFDALSAVITHMQNKYKENQLNSSTGVSYGSMYPALYRMFKSTKTGIDPAKLMQNDPAEMDKFRKLKESSQLKNVYDMAMLVADQNTAVGSLQTWNTDIQGQVSDYSKKLKQNEQFQTALSDFNQENAKVANDHYVTRLKQEILKDKPKAEQDMALDIWNTMYSKTMTSGGFLPSAGDIALAPLAHFNMASGNSKRVHDTARELAKKYANNPMFQPGGEHNRVLTVPKMGAKMTMMEVKGGWSPSKLESKTEFKSPEAAAYNYIIDQYTQGVQGWRTDYGTYAKSWTDPRGDRGGTDKKSMAYTGRFDAAAPETQNMKDLYQHIDAYKSLKGEAVVGFGGLTEKPEASDPKAVAFADKLFSDLLMGSALDLKTGLAKDQNRAAGDWKITPIGGHNSKFMAFHLIPDQNWIQDNMNSKSSQNKLIPYGDKSWEKGIVVYLPSDKVNTDFMRSVKPNMWDFTMARNKQVKAENPQGGSAILSDAGDQYLLQLTTLAVDPTGKLVTQSSNQYVNKTLNIGRFIDAYQANLDWAAMVNQATMQQAAQTYGEKDPNKVLGE